MATVSERTKNAKVPRERMSLAELRKRLGGIPAQRIQLVPPPGTATPRDVIEAEAAENRLFELIDGTLVEKTVGFMESSLAIEVAMLIRAYLAKHPVGIITGTDGPYRTGPRNVRYPDAGVLLWASLPDRKVPTDAIAKLPPDLAVEVLSRGNTRREMERKLNEYFAAGTKLVWYIDPRKRQAKCYTSPDEFIVVEENHALSGEPILPGLRIKLADLFQKATYNPPNE